MHGGIQYCLSLCGCITSYLGVPQRSEATKYIEAGLPVKKIVVSNFHIGGQVLGELC